MLPIANRLKKEGHDAEVLMYHAKKGGKYEEAYAGVLDMVAHRGEKSWAKKVAALQELAREGECIVVTDAYRASKDFHDAATLYPTFEPESVPRGSLRWGAWFDGEGFVAQHALIVDEGAWAGGLGPEVDAAMTMVRVSGNLGRGPQIAPEADELKSRGFRGLVQWGLNASDDHLVLSGDRMLGWTALHMHCFVADQDALGDVLSGKGMASIPNPFTLSAALTQPPWPSPTQHRGKRSQIEGLTSEQMGQVFWHDVKANPEERTLETLGLDGFVGVVRASASSMELAKARVMDVSHSAQFPEKQFRPDAGSQVRDILAWLEAEVGIYAC